LTALALWLLAWAGAGCNSQVSDASNAAADTNWLTDLPQAMARAKAEHKLVLLDFTGSDWCPPCKQLHAKVLSTDKFKTYADAKLVLVLVDFPRQKSQPDDLKQANDALKQRFGIEGYPTVILLDADGKQLDKQLGYGGGSVAEFIARLEKLNSNPG
jgi:thiol:disulfide interchange protein